MLIFLMASYTYISILRTFFYIINFRLNYIYVLNYSYKTYPESNFIRL